MAAVPCQNPEAPGSLGLTREECEREAWAIEPDGRHHRGAAAVVAGLAWALGVRPLLGLSYLPGLKQIEDIVYAWVAANRSELPQAKPHCLEHPGECGGKDEEN
ncbi:MAG: DUF393 domain-containing protein [Chloroflexi bacterium]|nr:DUF393 domain-containing protein [Chloroflexota bacterium]